MNTTSLKITVLALSVFSGATFAANQVNPRTPDQQAVATYAVCLDSARAWTSRLEKFQKDPKAVEPQLLAMEAAIFTNACGAAPVELAELPMNVRELAKANFVLNNAERIFKSRLESIIIDKRGQQSWKWAVPEYLPSR